MRTVANLGRLRSAHKAEVAVRSFCRGNTMAALEEEGGTLAMSHETFYYRDLQTERRSQPMPRTPLEKLKFGTQFTDHMFHIEHTASDGWGVPKLIPFGFLPVHPAAQALHYGVSCFEGMKAFCGADGRAHLFRPEMNVLRFHRSSRRLGLANFDAMELLKCLEELVRLDRSWLPCKEGFSLYIRPFMFASSFSLGVTAPTRSTISIVCSPVGPYFPTGLQPIKLFLSETHVRAWPGGVGDSKVAPNYGPTILPQQQAEEEYGTPQVLYTLPRSQDPNDSTVSEVGAMNVFFLIDKTDGRGLELITPPLDGTILPGVTRDSILQLTRSWQDFDVSERQLTVGELLQASKEQRLVEMFGAGTACIVQPIEALVRSSREELRACLKGLPSLAARIHKALSDIQYARVSSPWSVPIE